MGVVGEEDPQAKFSSNSFHLDIYPLEKKINTLGQSKASSFPNLF